MDIYFVNGAKLSFPHRAGAEADKSDPRFWNRLYLNNRDGTFREAAEEYGCKAAATAWARPPATTTTTATPTCSSPTPRPARRRRQRSTATKRGGASPTLRRRRDCAPRGWATSAGFFDYDNDGDLDLLILRYMQWRFDVDYRCGAGGRLRPRLLPPGFIRAANQFPLPQQRRRDVRRRRRNCGHRRPARQGTGRRVRRLRRRRIPRHRRGQRFISPISIPQPGRRRLQRRSSACRHCLRRRRKRVCRNGGGLRRSRRRRPSRPGDHHAVARALRAFLQRRRGGLRLRHGAVGTRRSDPVVFRLGHRRLRRGPRRIEGTVLRQRPRDGQHRSIPSPISATCSPRCSSAARAASSSTSPVRGRPVRDATGRPRRGGRRFRQ